MNTRITFKTFNRPCTLLCEAGGGLARKSCLQQNESRLNSLEGGREVDPDSRLSFIQKLNDNEIFVAIR